MRYIVMHKVDANMEAGGPPSARIVQDMGALVGASIQQGIFKDGAGLHRSARRVRLTFSGGERSVTKGPYAGGNELLASFAMIQARGIDHAVELATRVGRALGDCELEIGPVVEAWDLGLATKPEGVPERFLILRKADKDSEAGSPPPAGMKKIIEEFSAEGVLLSRASLYPSARGARLSKSRSWTDGPFTESKEMIAGFSILEVPSLADAKAWAERYAAILVDNEVDVREVVTA